MDPLHDLKWLVIILIILWVLWFLMGAKLSPDALEGPFLTPPNPIGTDEVYGPRR